MILASLNNELEEACWRANFRNSKRLDGEETDDDCDDKGVEVISQECRLDAANKGVKNNANRKQESRRDNVHSGTKMTTGQKATLLSSLLPCFKGAHLQRRYSCTCSKKHIGNGNDIVDQA